MNRKIGVCVGVVAVVLASAVWVWAGSKDDDDVGGHVMPGSLVGVNPVHHPDIFGNLTEAARWGFYHSPYGWFVGPQVDPRTYVRYERTMHRIAMARRIVKRSPPEYRPRPEYGPALPRQTTVPVRPVRAPPLQIAPVNDNRVVLN